MMADPHAHPYPTLGILHVSCKGHQQLCAVAGCIGLPAAIVAGDVCCQQHQELGQCNPGKQC